MHVQVGQFCFVYITIINTVGVENSTLFRRFNEKSFPFDSVKTTVITTCIIQSFCLFVMLANIWCANTRKPDALIFCWKNKQSFYKVNSTSCGFWWNYCWYFLRQPEIGCWEGGTRGSLSSIYTFRYIINYTNEIWFCSKICSLIDFLNRLNMSSQQSCLHFNVKLWLK